MNAPQSVQSSGVAGNIEPQRNVFVPGEVAHLAKSAVSGSAEFIQAMTMSDLFNAVVTTVAHNRGADHALPGMPSTEGVTDIQNGDFFSSAIAAASVWGVTGLVGLSIFIIGNLYVTLHKRLLAHHEAVVIIHKCYGVLLRIENFLNAAQRYCLKYNFQIDSLEIQEDLSNIFKLLDEITTQADVIDVYQNVIHGRTFRLETVDGTVIPVPESNRGIKLGFRARMVAGIHQITVDINSWSNRFNSIMIELNTHFTLLVSEFFMLSNLHQLNKTAAENKQFAQDLLTPSVKNPVWCMQLQIMLAPLLRARIILFSCALSTNTKLCREKINSEMQELEKARGVLSRIPAYFKRMYRLYKTGKKQINIKSFIDLMKDAVQRVEASVNYTQLPAEYQIVNAYVDRIKENLRQVVTHENVANIVDMLDEIYNISLSCGRLNSRGEADIKPFQSLHRTAAASILPKRKSIESAYELQTQPFTYTSKTVITEMLEDMVNSLCGEAQQTSVNDDSYHVASYSTENIRSILNRIQIEYNRKLIPSDAGKADFDSKATELAATQDQYNKLYKYVTKINFNPLKRTDPEKRGREIAACLFILERILVGAITIPPTTIAEICKKFQSMVARLQQNSPDILERIFFSFRILLSRTSNIHSLVEMVLDLSQTIHTRLYRSLDGLDDEVAASPPAAAAAAAALSSSPELSPIEEGDEDSASRLLPPRIRSGAAEPSDPGKKPSKLQLVKGLLTRKHPSNPGSAPGGGGGGGGKKRTRHYKIKKIKTKIARMSRRREQTQKHKKYTRRREN
jgi:hypothetical protein